ncbi:mammalian ependymin-related protein 1-like [Sycon ciliatum]|uniref:mammalian ependymin-related protein 1-like n=1 Tax=Sycon ciliatum TaxID=27933 RepID=UPI0031F6D55C
MKVLLVVALLVVVARSQVPEPCEAPNVWEGRVFEVVPSRRFERFGKISYDKLGERFRIIEELNGGNTTVRYDELYLHKEKIRYRFNLNTRVCTKEALTEPFQPIEVVTGARFESELYIGSSSVPGGSVAVDLFGGERTVEGPYQATFTTLQCIPVTSAHVSPTYGFVHWNFYDVTLGISDPNVFIPRSECLTL